MKLIMVYHLSSSSVSSNFPGFPLLLHIFSFLHNSLLLLFGSVSWYSFHSWRNKTSREEEGTLKEHNMIMMMMIGRAGGGGGGGGGGGSGLWWNREEATMMWTNHESWMILCPLYDETFLKFRILTHLEFGVLDHDLQMHHHGTYHKCSSKMDFPFFLNISQIDHDSSRRRWWWWSHAEKENIMRYRIQIIRLKISQVEYILLSREFGKEFIDVILIHLFQEFEDLENDDDLESNGKIIPLSLMHFILPIRWWSSRWVGSRDESRRRRVKLMMLEPID